MPNVNTRTDGPFAWFEALPPLTKLYMSAIFFTTVAVQIGLVSPYYLALIWDNVLKKFEIWRLVTCFLFMGSFSFPWLMLMMLLYNHGVALEAGIFAHRSADYAWVYVFSAIVMLGLSLLGHAGVTPEVVPPFLTVILVFSLLHVWSRHFKEQSVSVWGLVKMQGFYLPFAMLALHLMLGQSIMEPAIGILVGHLQYFFSSIYPRAGGSNLLGTPQWLINAVARSGIGTVNPAEVTAPMGAAARAFQGRGRRLAD